MEKRIKVVWICHFSNDQIKKNLLFSPLYFRKLFAKINNSQVNRWKDFAVWNTNAIRQFENFEDIDLTVVFPYGGIKGKKQCFDINGVHYVAFRSEDDRFVPVLWDMVIKPKKKEFRSNRKIISSIISENQPDIVHVIGAENPYYSIAALDIPSSIPSVVSLQTLMSSPGFLKNFPIRKESYDYTSAMEQQILNKCNYIGSIESSFKEIICKSINPNAVFLKMPLAVGVDVDNTQSEKEFDFVYFAANISKACDWAIEAFSIACRKRPELKLNVSGYYSEGYKSQLDARINELGISHQVIFTGAKSSHSEVLKQIKKSRFAILPLKVDLISGTIREAMACGLPVVSTITPGTPELNEKRESILLSEKGDFDNMAAQMLRLADNADFASTIQNNAILTVKEKYSNEGFMQLWHKAYYEIIDNYKNGTPFSDDIVLR